MYIENNQANGGPAHEAKLSEIYFEKDFLEEYQYKCKIPLDFKNSENCKNWVLGIKFVKDTKIHSTKKGPLHYYYYFPEGFI